MATPKEGPAELLKKLKNITRRRALRQILKNTEFNVSDPRPLCSSKDTEKSKQYWASYKNTN